MYAKTVTKKLSFKGDSSKTLSSSRDKKRKTSASSSLSGDSKQITESMEEKNEPIEILSATGRITSSSTVVTGHYALFQEELSIGDAIIITHPITLQQETKIVRMLVSNTSISISSAFSTDLISTTTFKYIKAPKDHDAEQQEAIKKAKINIQSEKAAFGTYASNNQQEAVYHVKKEGGFGSYKIVSESINGNTTRENLLQLRSKKKSDRYCN